MMKKKNFVFPLPLSFALVAGALSAHAQSSSQIPKGALTEIADARSAPEPGGTATNTTNMTAPDKASPDFSPQLPSWKDRIDVVRLFGAAPKYILHPYPSEKNILLPQFINVSGAVRNRLPDDQVQNGPPQGNRYEAQCSKEIQYFHTWDPATSQHSDMQISPGSKDQPSKTVIVVSAWRDASLITSVKDLQTLPNAGVYGEKHIMFELITMERGKPSTLLAADCVEGASGIQKDKCTRINPPVDFGTGVSMKATMAAFCAVQSASARPSAKPDESLGNSMAIDKAVALHDAKMLPFSMEAENAVEYAAKKSGLPIVNPAPVILVSSTPINPVPPPAVRVASALPIPITK